VAAFKNVGEISARRGNVHDLASWQCSDWRHLRDDRPDVIRYADVSQGSALHRARPPDLGRIERPEPDRAAETTGRI
jgi:hypothetical protein